MEKHKHETNLGYIEIVPYIYVGISKCCRPTFAQVEGEKLDINFEGKLNTEILMAGANFISSLVKQKIKIYIAYENKDSKAIIFIIAYLVLRGMSIDRAIDLIKKKKLEVEIEDDDRKLLLKFEKTLKEKNNLLNKRNNKNE